MVGKLTLSQMVAIFASRMITINNDFFLLLVSLNSPAVNYILHNCAPFTQYFKYIRLENRQEFVSLVENYRLNEFKTQVESIRRGLATIVPIVLLPLFTWQELELMVCGKREIDIELLKVCVLIFRYIFLKI